MKVPTPKNEPVWSYAKGSPERAGLKQALAKASAEVREIPLWIGGQKVETGAFADVVMPHEHRQVVGRAHQGTSAHAEQAIQAALAAKPTWSRLSFADRSSVFLKAAALLAGPFRDRMNAATMLGQSKTAFQSEIDAVCELADFWRFNVFYAEQLGMDQPLSPDGVWNRVEQRPLDGFIFAVSPFNFTSIAGNLPTAPALLGNTVVWKPAPTQMLSAAVIVDVLEAAGLPPGVINLVQGDAASIGAVALASPDLGGIHFTGSTATFQHLYAEVAKNIGKYRQYPRIVGETGGKDFVFAHPSADVDTLAVALLRGAFEYQGQKCSAASRAYVPASLWPRLQARLSDEIGAIRMGDIRDFTNFMGAVIDRRSFQKISGYLDLGRGPDTKLISGGVASDEKGFFIAPTLIESSDPKHRLMREEIFGPVLTVWPYPDRDLDQALNLCESSTPYALTGAIFAQDRRVIEALTDRLRDAAGNFYINDKPTGAVVGQQPFGGGRASGTNDKAGSAANLLRWISPRAIKETFAPPLDWRYPFMAEP
ncbi:MAG: L-glutamate gamma-semialdehyde dehydrogenase [Myxococcota bacterium]